MTIDTKQEETSMERSHAEFHNLYRAENIKNDISFLQYIYKDKEDIGLTTDSVTPELINELKSLGKSIYFFIASLSNRLTPVEYIESKYNFIQQNVRNGDKHIFFLAWNGITANDSFKRLLKQKFSLDRFSEEIVPKGIPAYGTKLSRYRSKLVLRKEDMEMNPGGKIRTIGRKLADGSGLDMREGIVWLPNGTAIPIFPNSYVPANQSQFITTRHGKSVQESGGDNPKFVGSGYWDLWENNKRISRSKGNQLKEDGFETARGLGRDFKVIVDTLKEKGYSFWPLDNHEPVPVFGSESANTKETSKSFLEGAGYTNSEFTPIFGLNSQKYGALTHLYKNEVMDEMIKIYSDTLKGETDKDKKKEIKELFKNRFYHFPEGESLIESDWRIAHAFVQLLKNNLGKRCVLCDHSGTLRVFEAIIRTLDFAEYATKKEGQDSIIAFVYQPGLNVRYDYLQHKNIPLKSDI